MKDIGLVVAVAVLVEAIVETLKPVWDKEKGWNRDALIALGVAVVACVLSGADLFALVGAPLAVPYVGSVLTGIIASRGANFIHDLFPRLSGILTALPAADKTVRSPDPYYVPRNPNPPGSGISSGGPG